MEFTLEFFSNHRYRVLKTLSDNQIKIKNDLYVPLSQQEIADISHFSKSKTNNILKELMENEYIFAYNNKRGKYALTDKGKKALKLMQKSNH